MTFINRFMYHLSSLVCLMNSPKKESAKRLKIRTKERDSSHLLNSLTVFICGKKNTKKGGNQNKKSVKYSEAELQKKNTNREEVLKTQIEEEQKT